MIELKRTRVRPLCVFTVALVLMMALSGASASDPKAAKVSDPQTTPTSVPPPVPARFEWLRKNVVPIRSADLRDSDFSDLKPIADRIGKSRVVMLGEQSHGDGTTFLMKARLVRYLHEELGFDVLAWESGMFSCREMEEAMRSDLPLARAVEKGLFQMWGSSAQVIPLLEYARSTHKTPRPLEMAGVDCQFTSGDSQAVFSEKLFKFLAPLGAAGPTAAQMDLLKKGIIQYEYYRMAEAERSRFKEFAEGLPPLIRVNKAVLEKAHGAREVSFWMRASDNLVATTRLYDVFQPGHQPTTQEQNLRDQAMGDTLVWLAKDYHPTRKIIVWAASMHIIRGASAIDTGNPQLNYKGLVTMGDVAFAKLGAEAYSVMFAAYLGTVGTAINPQVQFLPAAPPDSLDADLHRIGKEYLFLDFRGIDHAAAPWFRQGISSRPLGYVPMKTDWSRRFDAVVFTDKMVPSRAAAGPTVPAK
jgi:erythromycin esterase